MDILEDFGFLGCEGGEVQEGEGGEACVEKGKYLRGWKRRRGAQGKGGRGGEVSGVVR